MKELTNYNRMTGTRAFAAYLGEIKWEFVKMIRNPMFAVPTLFFPAMFYLLFAVLLYKGDPRGALQIFARMSVFGVMAPGLFGFAVSLAFEREYGLLAYKQALPMPPGSYLLARMAMAMIFAAIISLVLMALALFVSHAPLTFVQAAKVFCIEVLGVLPFCAIGLTVGTLVSGQAAPAVINLIYLPMAFLSGTFFPIDAAGPFISGLAPIWPSFHLANLVLGALDFNSVGTQWSHVIALVGFTVLFFTIALARLSSGGIRMFGPARSAAPGFPLRRALRIAMVWIAIGLVVIGFTNGKAQVAAATPAAATSDAATDTQSGSAATETAVADVPIGVAAPATAVIADFDKGSEIAAYGKGFYASGDEMRGGNSHATQSVIAGGAEDSAGALEVTGKIGDGLQYPFGGTAFFPVSTEAQQFMDYSSKQTLSFYARGDGRQYTVIFLAGVRVDAIPAMYMFTPGKDWTEVRVPLHEFGNLDLARVHGIVIGAGGPPGDFRFAIDNVELR